MPHQSFAVHVFRALLLCIILAPATAFSETVAYYEPHTGRVQIFERSELKALTPPVQPQAYVEAATGNLTFTVTFEDVVQNTGFGFDDATLGETRQATALAALQYINDVINVDTGAVVDVLFKVSELDARSFLAAAGTYFPTSPSQYSNGFAFEHIMTGIDPDGTTPDILVTVDFGYPWNNDTDTPTGTEYDLMSVLIHEYTHGLGFVALSDATGDSSISESNPGVFGIMAKGFERGNGTALWDSASPTFLGTSFDLRSDDLFFNGPEAIAKFGSRPPIYAPSSFATGSSLSHVDDGVAGGAIMEPFFARGRVEREYAPLEIGMLRDFGYTNAAAIVAGPAVQFQASDFTASEGAANGVLTVELSEAPGAGNSMTVDYATASGTATADDDYTPVSGTLTISDDATTGDIEVPILQDPDEEGDETVIVTLSNATGGYTVDEAADEATLTIQDDDGGRAVDFTQATYNVGEGGGSAVITVELDSAPGAGNTITVDYATESAGATPGDDYTETSGTLTFSDSETSETFSVPILQDTEADGDEGVRLVLSNPTAGTVLGPNNPATLVIADDEGTNTADFALSSYTVDESAGSVTLTVQLTQAPGAGSSVTVDYATADGSALAGADYTDTSGTLTISDTDTSGTIEIPILQDSDIEGTESFTVELSNPSSGLLVGTFNNPATVSIGDDDALFVDFGQGSYSVLESSSLNVTIELSRQPGAGNSVEIDYVSTGISAAAGQDYNAVIGTVAFANTETVKTIPVTIIQDDLLENNELFKITLRNPSTGLQLGDANNPTYVTILDDDIDSDGDGLSDQEESVLGTGIDDPDSDDDGLIDGDEVNVWGSDPLDDDSDNDGVLDGDEVSAGTDPVTVSKSIGAAGGTISRPGITVVIPPAALVSITDITIDRSSTNGFVLPSSVGTVAGTGVFDVGPDGLTADGGGTLATITISYPDADNDGFVDGVFGQANVLAESDLQAFRIEEGSGVVTVLPVTVDASANKVTFTTDTFSIFGPGGELEALPLPLSWMAPAAALLLLAGISVFLIRRPQFAKIALRRHHRRRKQP